MHYISFINRNTNPHDSLNWQIRFVSGQQQRRDVKRFIRLSLRTSPFFLPFVLVSSTVAVYLCSPVEDEDNQPPSLLSLSSLSSFSSPTLRPSSSWTRLDECSSTCKDKIPSEVPPWTSLGCDAFPATHLTVTSLEACESRPPSVSLSTSEVPEAKSKEDPHHLSPWHNRWSTGNTRWHNKQVNSMLLKHKDKLLAIAEQPTDLSQKIVVLVPLCGKTVDMAYLASLTTSVSCTDSTKQAQLANQTNQSKKLHVVGVDCSSIAMEQFSAEHKNLNIVKIDNKPDLSGISSSTTSTINQNKPLSSSSPFETYAGSAITLLAGDFFQLSPATEVHQVTSSNTSDLVVDAVWDRASMVAIQPHLREKYVNTIGSVLRKPGGRYLLQVVERGDATDPRGPPFTITEQNVRDLFEKKPWVQSVQVLETRSWTADETSWYETFNSWYRFGIRAKEVTYLIITK